MKRIVPFLAALALVIAFTGAPAIAAPLLQNRYVHGEPFNAISYDVLLDRSLLVDFDAARRQILTELLWRFRAEDHTVAFKLYVIDLVFMPVKAGDPPRTLEIPRTEIETLVNAGKLITVRASTDIPLPEINIASPTGLPNEEFLGAWSGRWDNILSHVLVVEEIRGREAIVVYAYGTAPTWRIYEGGWFRTKAHFQKNGVLEVPTRQGRATYQMRGKRLWATYEAVGALSRTWLDKIAQQ